MSKDEPSLAITLDSLPAQIASVVPEILAAVEVLVVDASGGRLDDIRKAHPSIRWVDFGPAPSGRVTIAHQRNLGVREAVHDIVVFTDCGCIPAPLWLRKLVEPLVSGEEKITCGQTGATGAVDPHRKGRADKQGVRYLTECPTINLALRREIVAEIGGFDERFDYGSDIDFSWRAVHRGIRIRYVPGAMSYHDWGRPWRQVRRSFSSGKARAQLYAKHVVGTGDQSIHKRHLNQHDAVPIAYPLFLLGLPLAIRYRAYLLLLLIPLWRGRREQPLVALADHLVLGAGFLVGAAKLLARPGTWITDEAGIYGGELRADDGERHAGVHRHRPID